MYLPVIEVKELNRLSEGKEVFLPVVALEGLRDNFGSILHPWFSHEGKFLTIPFPGDYRPDDVHARDAGHARKHLVEMKVHLGEGFLHVTDVVGGVADKIGPMPPVRPKDTNLVVGAE